MKHVILALLCAVCSFSAVSAQQTDKKKETVTFFVEGMDCSSCVKKIEKNISFEKGVTDLKCDLSTHTAEVTYKTDKTSKTKLVAAFKKIGMDAVPVEEGTACPANAEKKDGHQH